MHVQNLAFGGYLLALKVQFLPDVAQSFAPQVPFVSDVSGDDNILAIGKGRKIGTRRAGGGPQLNREGSDGEEGGRRDQKGNANVTADKI